MVRLIVILTLWPLLSSVGARAINKNTTQITTTSITDREAVCESAGGGSQCSPFQSESPGPKFEVGNTAAGSATLKSDTEALVEVTATDTITATVTAGSDPTFSFNQTQTGTVNPAPATTTVPGSNATTSALAVNQTQTGTENPALVTTTSLSSQTVNPALVTTTAPGSDATTSAFSINQTQTSTHVIIPTTTAGGDATTTTLLFNQTETGTFTSPTSTTTSTTPASATSTTASSDIQAANALNSIFSTLTANSPCTEGEDACVEGKFAQCVGGKFVLTQCGPDTTCVALPMGNVPGTTITCTTPEERDARLAAGSS